jgi:membrane-associated phospholipid phosphatase
MARPAEENSVGTRKDSVQPVETTAPPARRYRSVLFMVGLLSTIGVFALLTFLVETTPSSIDLQITLAIQSIDPSFFAGLMRLVSWPGFLPQSIIITLLIAFVLYRYGLHWESVTSLLAASLSGVINEGVKNMVQRPRPGVDLVDVFAVLESFSFPSGHVMFYTILFGFVWYLAYTLLERSMWRSLLLSLFGGFMLLVGVSRIYLGQHWASDVLGAYLLGGLTLVGIVFLHQWGKKRFFIHQPAAHPDSKKE